MANGKKKSKRKKRLAREQAAASTFSVRQGWNASAVAPRLDPRRLADLLQAAKEGDVGDYLTLAEEIEESDPYYRATLSTRKLAVQAIEPTVVPGGPDKRSLDLADAVRRDIVERPEFTPMVYDAMDAVAKGYAAVEIVWNVDRQPWRPAKYLWRDPRWFRYDRTDGRTLRLLDDAEPVDGVPLDPHKWILHEPQLKSGLPIRSGLALPAAYYFLVKTFDVASWIAFIETFGYPIRVGKFSKNATDQDKKTLERAVRNMGRDVGAVIPDDMVIDVVSGAQQGASIEHFQRLAEWADKQLVILILGQSATTDGTPGRLGSDDAQQKVRQDILRSDARQIGATLQRDLVEPYVNLNYGAQQAYPRLRFAVEEPEDIGVLVDSVAKLAPLGLSVRTQDLRERLRLPEPAPGDEVLEPPPSMPTAPAPNAVERLAAALNAQRRGAGAGLDDDLDELLEAQEWEPITRPLHDAVQDWAERMGSLDEAHERLPELLRSLNSQRFVERLAADLLRARGLGDLHFDDPD